MNVKQAIAGNKRIFNLFKIWGSRGVAPLFLLLHLTLRCNGNCSFCYQKKDKFYKKYKADINYLDFEKVILDIKKNFFFKPRIHLFGGEPLLYSDFDKVLDFLKINKFKASFTTNGLLLDKYIDKILASSVDQINISVDDLGERHNTNRGLKNGFEKIVENIKLLHNKKNEKPVLLNINCVILDSNYSRLVDIVNYYSKNLPFINTLTFEHAYHENAIVAANLDVLERQFKDIDKIKKEFKILFIPNIRKKDLRKFYNEEKFVNNKCYFPWLGLNILPNLDVTPGGGVLGCNVVVGNLKQGSIKKIWNNVSMKYFRSNILKKGVSEECAKCCHRQYY